MTIDCNEKELQAMAEMHKGNREEGARLQEEFITEFRNEYKDKDHCPCQEKCPHHGNCFECVTLHRGHRDHLPMCLWDMVNERICALSHITEHTIREYEDRHKQADN